MDSFWIGLLAVVGGAAMQGSFALPQKFVRGWPWEKSWLFYSIAGMILFPWLLVALVIPNAGEVYSNVSGGVLLSTALFGMGWGVGSVLFGLGLAAVGLALGFAIIISLTAALGTLVPMAVLHPEQLLSFRGALVIAGLLVVITGVALCSRAGALKEGGAASGGGSFTRGLIICIASGVMSPMLSFGFAFGSPIAEEAARLGADRANASIAIFAVAISAGFLVNAGYCLYLLAHNKTWSKGLPSDRPHNLACTLAMGFLWLFGFFLYGLGATGLGELGTSVGWAIFMTTMVVVANLWGLLTGEWKNADKRAFRYLAGGLTAMIGALVVIAYALA